MDGDFKGDFTRDSFNPQRLRQFSRVLMQQGRVQLDADWNEQADLLLYAQRKLIKDLVGPHWGTLDFDIDNNNSIKTTLNSFKIVQLSGSPADFSIKDGSYYVDGLLSVNAQDSKQPLTYMTQEPKPDALSNSRYWVFLDVWERQITYLEDDSIREVALGESGADTATRAEVVWQVRASAFPDIPSDIFTRFGPGGTDAQNGLQKVKFVESATQQLKEAFQSTFRGSLRALGKSTPDGNTNPCITPPDAQFRGEENQLYRVEVHTGGTQETATFKWSRENGSVVFPIKSVTGDTILLENLGRDSHRSLEPGDWVEIVDDDYLLQVATLQGPLPINTLLQVDTVDKMNLKVTLKGTLSGAPFPGVGQDQKKHPLLRRWDQKSGTGRAGQRPRLQKDGTIQIKESDSTWLILEDGVQVQFQPSGKTTDNPPKDNPPMRYRTGDYWLIPARTIIGDVLWPQENDSAGKPHPKALPPHGVEHHYALLAVASFIREDPGTAIDLRYMVPPLGKLAAIVDITLFPDL
jgi:hypothetical protein